MAVGTPKRISAAVLCSADATRVEPIRRHPSCRPRDVRTASARLPAHLGRRGPGAARRRRLPAAAPPFRLCNTFAQASGKLAFTIGKICPDNGMLMMLACWDQSAASASAPTSPQEATNWRTQSSNDSSGWRLEPRSRSSCSILFSAETAAIDRAGSPLRACSSTKCAEALSRRPRFHSAPRRPASPNAAAP